MFFIGFGDEIREKFNDDLHTVLNYAVGSIYEKKDQKLKLNRGKKKLNFKKNLFRKFKINS
jgi:hypothetical protein